MTKMFVGGEWIGARSEEVIPVISPVDGVKFAEIPRGAEADVTVRYRQRSALSMAHGAARRPRNVGAFW